MIKLAKMHRKSAPLLRSAFRFLVKVHSYLLFVLLAGLRLGLVVVHDADGGILLFHKGVDLVEVLAREEESLFRVAVADVQAHHVGMAAVLAHDRVDVLPGVELIVGGELHVVVDLETAARESGALFGHQRQQIQHGKRERDEGEQRISAAGRNAEQQQQNDQNPSADLHPLFARLERRLCGIDRGRDRFPGKRMFHSGDSFLSKRGRDYALILGALPAARRASRFATALA